MQTDDPRTGEMPTSGGMRPGPVGPALRATAGPPAGVRPVAIRIPSIQVDAEVERRPIVDGQMLDPTGPFVVAWYGTLGRLGAPGNVVLSGHLDYAKVGRAVLHRLGELEPGAEIELIGEDVSVYRFAVDRSWLVDAANPPMDEIVGQTDDETATIISYGGDFDPAAQQYLHRLIVRASRTR